MRRTSVMGDVHLCVVVPEHTGAFVHIWRCSVCEKLSDMMIPFVQLFGDPPGDAEPFLLEDVPPDMREAFGKALAESLSLAAGVVEIPPGHGDDASWDGDDEVLH